MHLPAPLAYPFYSAAQSKQCNAYLPNLDTLSRCAPSSLNQVLEQSASCMQPCSAAAPAVATTLLLRCSVRLRLLRCEHAAGMWPLFKLSGPEERYCDLLCHHCRFQWTLEYLVGAGFYVIPAYQPSDCSVDNTVCAVTGLFMRNWANLWAAITDLPIYQTL